MENPWLLSKFARPKQFQGLGLAPLEQIPFLQMCVGLSSEKKFPTQHVLVLVTRAIFWLDLLKGHLFAFPLYCFFESQVLMENPWLISNFAQPKLLQILGLAPSDQVPFLKMFLGLSTEKNFSEQHVLVLATRAIFLLDLSPGHHFAFP